jgi:Flp pilus assembly CpaF family ATPase
LDHETGPLRHDQRGVGTDGSTDPSPDGTVDHRKRLRDYSGLDWALVRSLRGQVADELTKRLPERASGIDESAREIGRTIINRVVSEHIEGQLRSGAGALSAQEQDLMVQAVFDSQFGLGRLQPLVDDETIENVEVRGHDRVTLTHVGGVIVDGPPVAANDEELVEQIGHLAGRAGITGRPFSPRNPQLDMRLHGGHRLSASNWTTPVPYVTIRRHRLIQVNLDDLVHYELMDSVCKDFLAACVRARMSIVVAGEQGAGKTTLTRALCNEIEPEEAIGTVETEYELHLDKSPDKHPRVNVWEAQPGNGQAGPDGRIPGEVTVDQLLRGSFRYNLDRVIVGEVRGGEVATMFEAMEAGAGSLSTIHARSSRAVVERLVTLAIKHTMGGTEYAYRQVANHIDLIVHIDKKSVRDRDGTRRMRRYIDSVLDVMPGEHGMPALTDVFAIREGELRPHTIPSWFDELGEVGYAGEAFLASVGAQAGAQT